MFLSAPWQAPKPNPARVAWPVSDIVASLPFLDLKLHLRVRVHGPGESCSGLEIKVLDSGVMGFEGLEGSSLG